MGTAIKSGDVAASQSAFSTLQTDAKSTTSPAIAAALAAAAQTVTEIEDLLSVFSKSEAPAANSDPITAILSTAYGQGSPSFERATDPTVALLESKYGAGAASGSSGATESM